ANTHAWPAGGGNWPVVFAPDENTLVISEARPAHTTVINLPDGSKREMPGEYAIGCHKPTNGHRVLTTVVQSGDPRQPLNQPLPLTPLGVFRGQATSPPGGRNAAVIRTLDLDTGKVTSSRPLARADLEKTLPISCPGSRALAIVQSTAEERQSAL